MKKALLISLILSITACTGIEVEPAHTDLDRKIKKTEGSEDWNNEIILRITQDPPQKAEKNEHK